MCLKSEHVDSRMGRENMKKQKVSKNLWKNGNREKWSRRKRRREEWQKAERRERVSHKNIGINCEKKPALHQSTNQRQEIITINQLRITSHADLMREAESPEKVKNVKVLLLKRTDRERSRPLLTHFLGSLFRRSVPFAPHADQHHSTYSSIFSPDLQPLNPALYAPDHRHLGLNSHQ